MEGENGTVSMSMCVCAAHLGGDAKLVRLLVENGADVNKKDSDGNSILMVGLGELCSYEWWYSRNNVNLT